MYVFMYNGMYVCMYVCTPGIGVFQSIRSGEVKYALSETEVDIRILKE